MANFGASVSPGAATGPPTLQSSPLDADAWSKGEIWLSVKDLSPLKRRVVLYNFDFGHGPETTTYLIVRVK